MGSARTSLQHPRALDLYLWADTVRARVPRAGLSARLAAFLRPATAGAAPLFYGVVYGSLGNGKSTAVRNAVRSLPSPKGVVYFSAELEGCGSEFSSSLAVAVGFMDNAYSTALPWGVLATALKEGAHAFRVKHGRPAVLVIDGVDNIARKDADFFRALQLFAKECSTMGSLRIVFVLSEGRTLQTLRESSAWLSAGMPFEVQDIDDDLAVAHLVSQGVVRPEAQEAVRTLAGGRFTLLSRVASSMPRQSLAAIKSELDVWTSVALITAGIAPTHGLFRELLAAGRVSSCEARTHLSDWGGPKTLDALLAAHILDLHHNGDCTAHARYIEVFLQERQDESAAEARFTDRVRQKPEPASEERAFGLRLGLVNDSIPRTRRS